MTKAKLDPERVEMLARTIEEAEYAMSEDDTSAFSLPSGFNMYYLYHECGTPCCIAGYAACLRPDGTLLEDGRSGGFGYDGAMAFLYGVAPKEVLEDYDHERFPRLYSLFEPDITGWQSITPEIAAAGIRHLLTLKDPSAFSWRTFMHKE